MIPIHIKTETFSEPDVALYYLVAAEGVYLVKKTGLYRSVTRADWIVGPQSQAPALELNLPKVPRAHMERVYGFFDAVYQNCQGEAIVFLFYDPDRGDFQIGVPRQTVRRYWYAGGWITEGHVEYDQMARPEGYLKIGDIHSHGKQSAFFSAVDDHDDQEDGLRIVIGRLDLEPPDVCASFVAAGYRFPKNGDDVAEPFTARISPPHEWLARVRVCDAPRYVSWTPP